MSRKMKDNTYADDFKATAVALDYPLKSQSANHFSMQLITYC